MNSAPELTPPSRSNVGAKYLNGIIWVTLLVGAIAVAVTSGSYAALGPLMVVFVVASLGMGANLLLFLWKLATGRFRQATHYGIGVILLAAVVFWFLNEFHNGDIGKISG